ncbi:MAG: hypothetical protein E7483_02665 [Ruminococcaceae bacterium]|nr:hypothetical protein [Oscillospiraceae bacterium]
MIKDNKTDEMYTEKQRSDREIIDMVTMAGITFEEDDGSQTFFEVVVPFVDDESGKIYFVCQEENSMGGELAFFYHYMGEVSAVEDDEEFGFVAQLYEEWGRKRAVAF